jgi:hypothetical protein
MLRKRNNKNTLHLNKNNDPIEQRLSYVKEILKDSTFLPKTVVYKDIDETFVKWAEDELKMVFEGNELPTYALFSNQRYSEYMQMWETMDDNNNLLLNFKVITRENNPKGGNLYTGAGIIPTTTKYLMNRVEALNDQGEMCSVEYRMAQPMAVDLNYKITLVTNKYELLNKFNMMMLDKFSSLHAYIYPNGHPMPMKLKNISDESDYTVDDRQYFAQTYDITLMAYIITEKDFDIEVKPVVSLRCIGGDIQKRKPQVEIEEFEIINTCPEKTKERYYNQPLKINISFQQCGNMRCEFTIDCNMTFTNYEGDNIRSCIIKVNDEPIVLNNNKVSVKENDVINIKITKINNSKSSRLIINGYNDDIIYDRKDDIVESELDFKNISNEIEIQ